MRRILVHLGPAPLVALGLWILAGCTLIPFFEMPAPVTASPTPSVPSEEPALVFFISEPGKFQAWVPISGDVHEYTVTRTLFGEPVECTIIALGLNSAYSMVQYCDLSPESIASHSSDEILNQMHDEVVRDFTVKLDTADRVLIEDVYPALKLSGQENMRGIGYDGTFKARIILAGNRGYLVAMSVHSENWCNCLHQMDQVLDSFHPDPDLSVPFEPNP